MGFTFLGHPPCWEISHQRLVAFHVTPPSVGPVAPEAPSMDTRPGVEAVPSPGSWSAGRGTLRRLPHLAGLGRVPALGLGQGGSRGLGQRLLISVRAHL